MKLVHFHNGTGGGVLSVIRNLLEYRQHADIENHVIFTINQNQIHHYKTPGLKGATSEQVFLYSQKWNFYYTCKQLAKLIEDKNTLLIAHDWLELAMISNLGLENPVVLFLHGDYDYYYQLAIKYEAYIDHFICVSSSIRENLSKQLPQRANDIHYLRYPVPNVSIMDTKEQLIQLVFAGRCEEAKGYYLLPQIHKALKKKNISVRWNIAGLGSDQSALQQIWEKEDVTFHGNLSQVKLFELLSRAHFFILPSFAEGMPVSIVEAMKAGVIPVVNDLKGGIQELVQNEITGYRIPNNDPLLFADRIADLALNTNKRNRFAANAKEFASTYFDPEKNTKLIEDCFLKAMVSVKKKKAKKMAGSRLDQPYLPNAIVSTIRSFT